MKVLKIGAEWCLGCIVMKPIWQEIEKEHKWLKTEYFDFDKEREIVEKYDITDTLPTFIFLNNSGEEFLRLQGEPSKKELIKIILQNKDK